MDKKKIAVLFGGQSSEHIVSCMSAINVIKHIDKEKYDIILIGITEEGKWIKTDNVMQIESGIWRNGRIGAVLSPDATDQSVLLIDQTKVEKVKVDVVFPVLHGLFGEDGTIQGLLEMAQIPYVGCGVLSSAIAMDKLYTKIVVDTLNVRQADFLAVTRSEIKDMPAIVARVEAKFSYPVFIKPANAGSSKGVSKADNAERLEAGIIAALEHDYKILVEEMIIGREIECAVFGGGSDEVEASGVGEIVAAAEFYDFEAKYFNSQSQTVVDPDLPGNATETIRQMAKSIFTAVDGYGLARVDFFVTADGEVVFNEINTMPGFTAISMYPMLWEAQGVGKKALISKLIEHAQLRDQI